MISIYWLNEIQTKFKKGIPRIQKLYNYEREWIMSYVEKDDTTIKENLNYLFNITVSHRIKNFCTTRDKIRTYLWIY